MLTGNSLKFKHISQNTVKLMYALLGNQDLLKYIYFLGDYDPLTKSSSELDIADIRNKSFILTKFDPKILLATKVMLFVNPYKGKFPKDAVTDDVYAIDIIVPNDFWVVKNTSELRAYEIAHQIALTIDRKGIAGIGNCNIFDYNSYKVDDTFSGVTLFVLTQNVGYKK